MLHGWIGSPPRFVLTIGNEGGLLLDLAGDRIEGEWRASGLDEAALRPLAEVLSARPQTAVVIVVDLVEQAYRRETLPRLNPLDRAKVKQRRLDSAFPGAPVRGGLALGRAADDARSDRYLLAAVPDGDDWSRWAGFLRSISNPIAGLVLLPIEVTELIERLARSTAPDGGEPRDWTVLVNHQRTGGFRQVVVHRGQLVLTRLTPSLVAGASMAEVAAEMQRELRATLGYMTRLGYRPGGGLDVLLLGPAALRAELDAPLPGATCRVIDPEDAATSLGLKLLAGPARDQPAAEAAAGADGTQLLAAWAGRKRRPTLQLLPPDLRARMTRRLARRGATAALAASAVGLVSYSALSAATGLQVEHEIEFLDAWRETTRTRVEQAAEQTDRIGAEADAIRALLTAHRHLHADRTDLFVALRTLRSALARDEQLRGLAWTLVRPTAAAGRRGPSTEPRDFVLDLTLDLGHLDDPAAAVTATERFAERLDQAFPERPVTVTRQAVNILPHQAFIGGDVGSGTNDHGAGMSAELQVGAAP